MSGKTPGSVRVRVDLLEVKVCSGICRPGLLCCAANKVYSGRYFQAVPLGGRNPLVPRYVSGSSAPGLARVSLLASQSLRGSYGIRFCPPVGGVAVEAGSAAIGSLQKSVSGRLPMRAPIWLAC